MNESKYKKSTAFIAKCINTCLSLAKIVVQSKFSVKLPQPKEEKCIVLATGPSLASTMEKYPDKLKNTSLICVNTFANSLEFKQLKPKYYVMLDPYFWEGNTDDIKTTFNNLKESDWKICLFVPQYAINKKVFKTLRSSNNKIQIIPFNYTVFKGVSSIAHWCYSKNLAMPQSLNVSIAALFIGVNMGFKEIYLVGADHTWHQDLMMNDDNIMHTKVPHFYENKDTVKFAPFYKGRNKERGTYKAHEFFDIWSRTFNAYQQVQTYTMSTKSKIYNASEQSFIDAFERKKLLQ